MMQRPDDRNSALNELWAREAIRDCLARYCRGIDRCDAETLRGAYWPGAIDDHVFWRGPIEDFIPFVMPVLQSRDQTIHRLGQSLIRVNGDSADVETYFDSYERLRRKDGGRNDLTAAGRYLDRFEQRDGQWRIAARRVVLDAFRVWPDSADWDRGLFGQRIQLGQHGQADPSAALFHGAVL